MRILVLACLLAGGFAQASGPTSHLKCYLTTVDGNTTIVRYEFEGQAINTVKDPKGFAILLAGSNVFKSDGTTKIEIKNALECVAEKDKFQNSKARKLDTELPQ